MGTYGVRTPPGGVEPSGGGGPERLLSGLNHMGTSLAAQQLAGVRTQTVGRPLRGPVVLFTRVIGTAGRTGQNRGAIFPRCAARRGESDGQRRRRAGMMRPAGSPPSRRRPSSADLGFSELICTVRARYDRAAP